MFLTHPDVTEAVVLVGARREAQLSQQEARHSDGSDNAWHPAQSTCFTWAWLFIQTKTFQHKSILLKTIVCKQYAKNGWELYSHWHYQATSINTDPQTSTPYTEQRSIATTLHGKGFYASVRQS